MYLGRRAEKDQQAQGATADGASRLGSLAEAVVSHEDPVSATAGASGRDPDAEPPADSVLEDSPQQVTVLAVADNTFKSSDDRRDVAIPLITYCLQDGDRDLHSLWRTTTNRVITILDTVQSLKQASELDPNNVWACANLLDSHLMQVGRRLTNFSGYTTSPKAF